MKFIIDNTTECSDERAMEYVIHVIGMGLISGEGAALGLQYCYSTGFKDGTMVSVIKRKSGTQKFIIHNNKGEVR